MGFGNKYSITILGLSWRLSAWNEELKPTQCGFCIQCQKHDCEKNKHESLFPQSSYRLNNKFNWLLSSWILALIQKRWKRLKIH